MKVSTAGFSRDEGFALPTIIIAAVILITVLVTAVAASASISAGLDSQYYNRLAREAAEAGLARARSCLRENNYVPSWTTSSLFPNTDCLGGSQCTGSPNCYVLMNGNVRSFFRVEPPVDHTVALTLKSYGRVEILRTSNNEVWRVYDYVADDRVVFP